MGKVFSLMGRPMRNFNLEDRAHKIISQTKPIAAPKHKSDQIDYERILKDYPEVYEEGLQKSDTLNKNLRQVYVESHNNTIEQPQNPERPLPLDRAQVESFEYGVKEPIKVPLGRVTLSGALKFITSHQEDPIVNSPKNIAKDYQIPEETIRNILKYFRVYEVYIPNERKVKAKFAGPSIPRVKVITHHRKRLSSGGNE